MHILRKYGGRSCGVGRRPLARTQGASIAAPLMLPASDERRRALWFYETFENATVSGFSTTLATGAISVAPKRLAAWSLITLVTGILLGQNSSVSAGTISKRQSTLNDGALLFTTSGIVQGSAYTWETGKIAIDADL
ncbi:MULTISPECIES: hypothetical protein [unclassified Devosia]|uniref:hypothetical protein n=1 Tax=unclassified Devosia TaxID=196773 RepID=UPI001AC404DC|nr:MULTISPECIES: hypothetical protein [unclassified Devosia]MBN9304124.1 hypothetical protein [Devosia sp.]